MVPTIDHIAGQERLVRRVKVALESCWQDGTRLPHILLVGGPGLGKTMLAHLLSKELGVQIHERLAQVVNTPASLNGLLLSARNKDIVFLDEIHECLPNIQTLLYRAMEGGTIFLESRDERTLPMKINDISVVGATTDEFRLLGPLRDRFKMVLPFELYDASSLAKIVQQWAQQQQILLDPTLAGEIGKRARGTPRIAIRLLESCHRFARSRGDQAITIEHFRETMNLDGIDSLGLGPNEQQIIRFLTNQNCKPVRLHTLEAATGIPRRTLQEVVEPFLLRLGLIERAPQGRAITDAGVEHVRRMDATESISTEAI